MQRSFKDFVNKKHRDAVRQLGILERILDKSGLRVRNFLHEGDVYEEPYIFVYSPIRGSFDGIRLYKIGDGIAFRIQNQENSHPYGNAYPVEVEEMFGDFMADEDVDEKESAKKVIEAVVKQVKMFFEKSQVADRELQQSSIDKATNTGTVALRTQGTDYSSLVFSRNPH